MLQVSTTSTRFHQQSACRLCPQGKFQNELKSSSCKDCDVGKYGHIPGLKAAVQCKNCPAGRYMNSTGASVCHGCPIGKFVSSTGSTDESFCDDCPSGRYGSIMGLAQCSGCPAGQGALTGPTGQTSVSGCVDCAIGYYSSGDSPCLECPVGKIGTKIRALSCMDCPQDSTLRLLEALLAQNAQLVRSHMARDTVSATYTQRLCLHQILLLPLHNRLDSLPIHQRHSQVEIPHASRQDNQLPTPRSSEEHKVEKEGSCLAFWSMSKAPPGSRPILGCASLHDISTKTLEPKARRGSCLCRSPTLGLVLPSSNLWRFEPMACTSPKTTLSSNAPQ